MPSSSQKASMLKTVKLNAEYCSSLLIYQQHHFSSLGCSSSLSQLHPPLLFLCLVNYCKRRACVIMISVVVK